MVIGAVKVDEDEETIEERESFEFESEIREDGELRFSTTSA